MNYSDFVGLYSISKTLRFELKPTPATKKLLDDSGVKETDKIRHEHFKQAKKILDEVHREFINDALKNVSLSTSDLQDYIKLTLDKASKKADVQKAQKKIFSSFEQAYKITNYEWQEKLDAKKFFLQSPGIQLEIASQLAEKIAKNLEMNEDDVKNTLKQFDKFSTYFKGYAENRKNCYSFDGKATEIANRTIAQNLITFYKNIEKFNKYYSGNSLLADDVSKYFLLENYNQFITQQSIAQNYNVKIGELNYIINQERQKQKKDAKANLPLFKVLYKQILGDATKEVPFEFIKDDAEYKAIIHNLKDKMPKWIEEIEDHFVSQAKQLQNPEGVYLGKKAINTLLQKYISIDVRPLINEELPELAKNKSSKTDDDESLRNQFISVKDFFEALDKVQEQSETSILRSDESAALLPSQFIWNKLCNDIEKDVKVAKDSAPKIDTSNKNSVKSALDSFNDLFRMYSYFELRYKNQPVAVMDEDAKFYQIFNAEDTPFANEKDKRFSQVYDLIRNYLTKKQYSLDKWKLNFDCSILLGGWDLNKEPEKHGVLLRHKQQYYLAIIDNSAKNAFDKKENLDLYTAGADDWQKMEYKLLPGANKMLPKCLFSKSFRENFGVPSDIDVLYKNDEYKKGDKFDINKMHKLIDFYKDAIKKYEGWSMYEFVFSDTKTYQSIDQFYHEVDRFAYRLDFVNINNQVLSKMNENGQIYLFEISNKDWLKEARGKANLHTQYFLNTFRGGDFKLNGEAEIFFRPKSIEAKVDKERKSKHEIIENRRFSEDKILFHVPITFNRNSKLSSNFAFNQHAIERIKTNGVNAVIGIDRGEKHLAYVAVVDKNGKLLDKPVSLNQIHSICKGRDFPKDYFDELKKREDERRSNRQDWDAVRRIKDLKDGYVGHCVKQVVDLMVKHNAVVALENLNFGFKQGRSKIERSTYNQFEQALLKKLQYVVDKNKDDDEIFGVQKGVQLAPPDVAPGKISNHMGFVFYVDPSYTSAIDPKTGYRQHVRLDDRVKTKNFSKFVDDAFDKIYFKDDKLIFEFNWRGLAKAQNGLGVSKNKKTDIKQDKKWGITLDVPRTVFHKNVAGKSETEIVNPQQLLICSLNEAGIKLNEDIKLQLVKNTNLSSKFVKSFVYCFNLANKLRNQIDGEDAIISPVYPNGFDSRNQKLDGKYKWNGDANGVYNIARKGAILLQKLNKASTPKEFNCKVSSEEYDGFVGGEK